MLYDIYSMKRDQFINKHKNLNIAQSELDRKWRVLQEQEETQRLFEEAMQYNSLQATAGASGGGSSNVEPAFRLMFTDISFAYTLVGNATNVNDWNTYLELPTNGDPFTSVQVTGNEVALYGGSDITITEYKLKASGSKPVIPWLVSVIDEGGVIVQLDNQAFGSQSDLYLVDLPAVTITDYGSFLSNTSLTSVSLPALVELGPACFSSCESLVTISLPSLTLDNEESFASCTSLTTANLPLLTVIGDSTFTGCTSLTLVNAPLLTSIGSFSFNGCTSLVNIDYPLVTTAGSQSFAQCTSLSNVNLPLLTNIIQTIFTDCSSLTSISLPSLLTAGELCFNSCINLQTIDLPLVTTLGLRCFENCQDLEVLNIPSCTNLGGTVGNNNMFNFISGNTIALTIPASRMTCNAGNPDGDIQFLQANNTVTITTT